MGGSVENMKEVRMEKIIKVEKWWGLEPLDSTERIVKVVWRIIDTGVSTCRPHFPQQRFYFTRLYREGGEVDLCPFVLIVVVLMSIIYMPIVLTIEYSMNDVAGKANTPTCLCSDIVDKSLFGMIL